MARICVQNTFIHMVDETEAGLLPKTKRSTSVPASQRFGDEAVYAKGTEDLDRSTEASSTADASEAFSSSSPLCGSSTPCSLEDELPYQAPGDWPEVYNATCTWTPSMMPVFVVGPAVVDPPPAEHPVAREPTARTSLRKLNSQAKAWVPEKASVPVSKAANKEAVVLARKLAQVMEAVKSVLVTCMWICEVEVTEDQFGPCVVIRIKPEHFDRQSDILMLAKMTITSNVVSTETLHFLGCQADPFVPMPPSGLAVKVCSVKDEQRVCWDLLQRGFCNYGEHCHWRHPKAQKRISVKTLLADESSF